MRTISLKIPEQLDQEIHQLARKRRLSRSVVMREALAGATRQLRKSALDLAGELAGCLNGPCDLSTSPSRMRGYGE